ncbi:MAG: PIN domain-containing protein [Gammaproteobacteria bacterium]
MEWYFLNRGLSGKRSLESLDEVLRRLDGVQKSLDSDPVIAANSYLKWAEEAETRLRELFASQSVVRGLHSERYWRIQAMARETHRPLSLIRSEISEQYDRITHIQGQICHYAQVLQCPESDLLVVLDTNVLVHGQPFEMVNWHVELNVKSVMLILPVIIIDELDSVKDNGQRKARAPLYSLDRLLPPKRALKRSRVRDNVTLQVVDEPSDHERNARADDEIVRQVAYLGMLADRELLLLTRDRGMRVRAETAGIQVRMLPEKLERSRDEQETMT